MSVCTLEQAVVCFEEWWNTDFMECRHKRYINIVDVEIIRMHSQWNNSNNDNNDFISVALFHVKHAQLL